MRSAAHAPILGASYIALTIKQMSKTAFTPEYRLVVEVVREARRKAHLTQRGLAERMGVHHSWVAKVEMGERRLDLVEFCRLFAACRVDPMPALSQLVRQYIVQPNFTGSRGRR